MFRWICNCRYTLYFRIANFYEFYRSIWIQYGIMKQGKSSFYLNLKSNYILEINTNTNTFWFTTRRLVLFGRLAEGWLVLFFVLFCFLGLCLGATFGTLPALVRRKICLTTNISISFIFSSYQKWMRTKTVKIVYNERKSLFSSIFFYIF